MFEGKKGYVPLKVVSINGITGKGKSLMINLLASFLQHLEKPVSLYGDNRVLNWTKSSFRLLIRRLLQ